MAKNDQAPNAYTKLQSTPRGGIHPQCPQCPMKHTLNHRLAHSTRTSDNGASCRCWGGTLLREHRVEGAHGGGGGGHKWEPVPPSPPEVSDIGSPSPPTTPPPAAAEPPAAPHPPPLRCSVPHTPTTRRPGAPHHPPFHSFAAAPVPQSRFAAHGAHHCPRGTNCRLVSRQ